MDLITRRFTVRRNLLAFDNDCAALPTDARLSVFTSDIVTEGVHYPVGAAGGASTAIGKAEARGRNKLVVDGRSSTISGKGWEHFTASEI